MSASVDVAVVGGGPAGCAAALAALRAGARVAIIDRARFPRDKCCGDGLTTAALRELEALGLELSRLPSFVAVDELVLEGEEHRAVLPLGGAGGIAAGVCRRVELDAALVELACGRGAALHEGIAVTGLEAAGGPITLHLADGHTLTADSVVAADGAWSAVRRALPGGEARRGEPQHWHAYRTYVRDVSPAAATQLLVAFERSLLPGYAWSFPLGDGRANVGVCLSRTTRVAGGELLTRCEEALNSPALSSFLGPTARREGALRSWPIPAPIGALPLSALGGRVLFAGDAARTADPFTGEGIAQALRSGGAAGAAVTGGPPIAAAERYSATLRGQLGDDARLASLCHAVMRHELANRAAITLGRAHHRLAHGIGRFLYEDFPRGDLLHPKRWAALAHPAPLPYPELAPAR